MAPGRKKSAKGVALPDDHRTWKVGDLVLAKVKGYPAWPAKVDAPENAKMCPRTAKVFVQYFGTKDYGYVSQSELSEFTPEVRAIVEKKARSCVKGPSHTSYRVAVKEICEFSDKFTVKDGKFVSESAEVVVKEHGTEEKCDGAEDNREEAGVSVLQDGVKCPEETKQERVTDREEAGKLVEGNNEDNTNDEAATVLVDFANTACLIEKLTAETEGSSEGTHICICRKEEMATMDTEVSEARVLRTFERRKKGPKIAKDENEKPEERISTKEYVTQETEEEKSLERISTKENGGEKEEKPLERISTGDTREEKPFESLCMKEDGGDTTVCVETGQEEKPLERIFTKEDGDDTIMCEKTEFGDTPSKRLSIEEHQGVSRISGNTERALERLSDKEDGGDTHVEKHEADKKLKHSNSDEAVLEKKRKPSSEVHHKDLKSKHMKDENLPPLKRQRFREGETHKAATKRKVASPDPAPEKAETNKIREAYEAAKQLKQRSAPKDEAVSTSLKFLGVAAQARKLSGGDSAVFMRPEQLRKSENHVSTNGNRDKMEAFQGMLETLTTTRECISRATRFAMECANKGFAKKVMDVIMSKLKNEQVHKKRLALLFLVDSMTQQNHHRTDGYAPFLEACVSRFLLLVAPPDGPAENRKQCLKVASLWLERKIMEESILKNAISRLKGRQRHPTDEMAADEYASGDLDRDPTSARTTDGVYSHFRHEGDEELHSPPPLPESPPPSPPPRPPNSPSPSLLQQRGQ